MGRIKEILDQLKSQLDENSAKPNSEGIMNRDETDVLREKFIFEPPASEEEIHALEKEVGITIPNDYREFLLLHNGMNLFHSYLVTYRFFSLDEIRKHFPIVQEDREDMELEPNKDYPVAKYPDVGYVMIADEKVEKNSSQGAIYVGHIEPEITKESFTTFLEKVIETSGDFFWSNQGLPYY